MSIGTVGAREVSVSIPSDASAVRWGEVAALGVDVASAHANAPIADETRDLLGPHETRGKYDQRARYNGAIRVVSRRWMLSNWHG